METQCTPKRGDISLNGSFGTPGSQSSQESMSNDGLLSTPRQNLLRNPAVDRLRQGGNTPKSPVLKIPESPVMQRLGYGTGVGVYLLERSPMGCGDLRSPWAIKKTVQVADTTIDEPDHDLYVARIQYEAEILKKLSHPNIIGYRAYGQNSPGDAYLAMEKANQSLADLIDERVDEVMLVENCDGAAPFPANRIEKVALDVSKALMYLHDEVKMVHGDLKSANVLVFGDYEKIKLCDFGVSRKLTKDGTVDGTYVGTEIWCPMEVIRQKRREEHVPITHKADIFAFGLTIYEMISLKPPHLSSAEESCMGNESEPEPEAKNTDSSTDPTKDEGNETYDDDDGGFDELAYEEALARYVGTRPPLPDMEFSPSYTTILGIFYCCTEEDTTKRPDAKDIVAALSDVEKELQSKD